MTPLWIALSFCLVVALFYLGPEWQIRVLRRSGLYPAKGQASLDDVKRLLREGHSTLALRCYREIREAPAKPGPGPANDTRTTQDRP